MIRTANEYESAKEYVDRDMEFYDYTLSEKMTSEEYNLYLQDTEYYCDVLYEKLREIEDIIEYLEYYGTTKINNIKDNIKKQEVILNKMAKQYNNEKYVSEAVTWITNPVSLTEDRDGKKIPIAEVTKEYAVTSSGTKTNHQNIKCVLKKTNKECYSDNIEECVKKKHYTSMYRLDAPEEIEEILEFELTDPDNFNFFDCEPINCDIEYLGKNIDNRIVIKIKSNSMEKHYENFNYDIYNESSLDKIDHYEQPKQSSRIHDIQSDIVDKINNHNNKNYINDVIEYHKNMTLNQEKSDILHDYSTNINQ